MDMTKPALPDLDLEYLDIPMQIVIESVDSICRDSADTQYMLIQINVSKSPKQLTYKML